MPNAFAIAMGGLRLSRAEIRILLAKVHQSPVDLLKFAVDVGLHVVVAVYHGQSEQKLLFDDFTRLTENPSI
jgi:hypothetical protein